MVQLGEVATRFNEIVHPGDRDSGTMRFVGLEHIEPHTGHRLGESRIDCASMTGRKPLFRRGQIVYGYLRPYLNKVWIAEFDGCSSVDQFAFDVDSNRANVEYIAWFMRSEVFLQRAASATTTGQLPRISIDQILSTPVSLPSLEDQNQIVNEIARRQQLARSASTALQQRLAGR